MQDCGDPSCMNCYPRQGVDFAFPPVDAPRKARKHESETLMRFGANRAEHRKNVRAMRKEMRERAKVRAKHDANKSGTFTPGKGFDQ